MITTALAKLDVAGGVGEPALVEQLEQEVQRLRVRLLDHRRNGTTQNGCARAT